jgi:quinol monooxygenase YgiN
MINVIAHYRERQGSADQVAAVLARHVAATRLESGCVQFIAYRSRTAPDEFVLYEQYQDEESFEFHRQTPHFREYVEGSIVPLLAERIWDRYEEVA